jgi:hypothetical protein
VKRAAWVCAAAALALWACPPDVIDHGYSDGGPPDGSGPFVCASNAECPCGYACFSLDGGANACVLHAPATCHMTSDCIHAGPNLICIETFRDGGSCGLSCQPDAG